MSRHPRPKRRSTMERVSMGELSRVYLRSVELDGGIKASTKEHRDNHHLSLPLLANVGKLPFPRSGLRKKNWIFPQARNSAPLSQPSVACAKTDAVRMPHHTLRHLLATQCIEKHRHPCPFPTAWSFRRRSLGNEDLRRDHSLAMGEKVVSKPHLTWLTFEILLLVLRFYYLLDHNFFIVVGLKKFRNQLSSVSVWVGLGEELLIDATDIFLRKTRAV
jgi:hypothetical protein